MSSITTRPQLEQLFSHYEALEMSMIPLGKYGSEHKPKDPIAPFGFWLPKNEGKCIIYKTAQQMLNAMANAKRNLGVLTGHPMKDGRCLVIIDVDNKAAVGKDGFDQLVTLESGLGVLPQSVRVKTQSGGLHIYLAYDPVRFHLTNSNSGLKPILFKAGLIDAGSNGRKLGIDIRAFGGQIVIPPSATHKSVYEYEDTEAVLTNGLVIENIPDAWAEALMSGASSAKQAVTRTRPINVKTDQSNVSSSPTEIKAAEVSATDSMVERFEKLELPEPETRIEQPVRFAKLPKTIKESLERNKDATDRSEAAFSVMGTCCHLGITHPEDVRDVLMLPEAGRVRDWMMEEISRVGWQYPIETALRSLMLRQVTSLQSNPTQQQGNAALRALRQAQQEEMEANTPDFLREYMTEQTGAVA
jgi:hypothetical protein